MNIPMKYEDVVAQLDAALGREAMLRQELADHDSATLLINAWVDTHGKQIPWDKAIEIIAVATKMPDAEKTRLLCLDDQYELLQQRLTVAEQRYDSLRSAAQRYLDFRHAGDCGQGYQFTGVHPQTELKAALKPEAEGEGS